MALAANTQNGRIKGNGDHANAAGLTSKPEHT